jgi:hypothetical protein
MKVYTEEDYKSGDGMLTTVWGPSIWHFLHTMSFNYPVHPTNRNKIKYRNFILSLKDVLPCGKCRENLKKNFLKLPITMKDMKSRHTFSLYVYKLHEVVNKMLNKKSGLSFENVRERYENFRARCNEPVRSKLSINNLSKTKYRGNLKSRSMRMQKEVSTIGAGDFINKTKKFKEITGVRYNGTLKNRSLRRPVKKESGCVKPIYGEKSKCVLHIVPQSVKCETITIDPRCKKRN